jgi:hypothetical protein
MLTDTCRFLSTQLDRGLAELTSHGPSEKSKLDHLFCDFFE